MPPMLFQNSRGSCDLEDFRKMRPRVQHYIVFQGDCSDEESAEIKFLLDAATEPERSAISACWPIEFDEWDLEIGMGWRERERPQQKLL